ncbi:MAG: hypothetical protein QM608_12825 [Caulobacter sp.]
MKTLILTIAALTVSTTASAQTTLARDEAQPAKGAFTVGQMEDADVVDAANRKTGEIEHVLLDVAGKPTAVVIEIDRKGPDKKVVVALADLTVSPDPRDAGDLIARTRLNKAQLLALPDWKG